jgi:hypothetical protein
MTLSPLYTSETSSPGHLRGSIFVTEAAREYLDSKFPHSNGVHLELIITFSLRLSILLQNSSRAPDSMVTLRR